LVTPGLVELDGLPGVLGSLREPAAIVHVARLLVVVALVSTLALDTPFNLSLSKAQGKV
jgi:hypothetical protein